MLAQFPSARDLIGVALVIAAVAVHRDHAAANPKTQTASAEPIKA